MPRKASDKNGIQGDKKKKSTQVPYQFYGYSLQQTVFLFRLLSIETGDIISLEVFDDVGVESDSGKTAIQVKSAQKHNPVSNHALDLWKTFSNWIDMVKSGDLILENTVFEIYCSKAKDSDIALRFSNAQNEENAETEYVYAKEIFFSEDVEIAETIQPYITNVFSTDKEIFKKIICQFTLTFCSSTPQEDLFEILKYRLIGDDIISDVGIWASGWVKNSLDKLLEGDKTPSIRRDLFITQLKAYIRKLNTNNILIGCANKPDTSEVQNELKSLRTYVKQLDLINCSDEDKFNAISDYLRASADRTMWGNKGIVHDSSFDELEEGLKRFWSNTKKVVLIENKQCNEIEKGELIYLKCSNHTLNLQSMSVPEYFISGSYHEISEDKIVGWHPDYENKLIELAEEGKKNGITK